MANPSSMPVKNKASTKTSPVIPATTSFILSPEHLHDIAKQHQPLKEAGHPDPIDYGIKGHLQGGRNLPRPGISANLNPPLKKGGRGDFKMAKAC